MNSQKIVNDLGASIKIPWKTLNILVKKLNLCIGSAIHDAILNKDDIVILNIGIGTLSIRLADMQCKFIPSKDLKATIKQTIDQEVDPLELELEQALIAKLITVCNEEI